MVQNPTRILATHPESLYPQFDRSLNHPDALIFCKVPHRFGYVLHFFANSSSGDLIAGIRCGTWLAALGRLRATEDARRAEKIDIFNAF